MPPDRDSSRQPAGSTVRISPGKTKRTISDEQQHTPRRVPSDPGRATQVSPIDQIYDAGPGALEIVVVLQRDQGNEVLFQELCSALAILAAEDRRYTVYVSTDARKETHTPLDNYGDSIEQVLAAAAHEEVLFRKRNRDSKSSE